jgi:hypothetical protein
VAATRERLRELEAEIRDGLESFFRTGMRLLEIRDRELYRADGFATWEDYCRTRWEWSHRHANRMITAADYRSALPSLSGGTKLIPAGGDRPNEWSEATVRELTRLGNKRDAARVAAKVVKAVEKGARQAAGDPKAKPLRLTAGVVRKFVDEDLGVDRAKQAKETKKQREQAHEEAAHPDVGRYLFTLADDLGRERARFATLGEADWKRYREHSPHLIERAIAACQSLEAVLRAALAGDG